MTNKYLLKISELTDENKAVARTFLESSAAAVPAHLAGAYIGEGFGSKYLKDRTLNLGKFKNLHLKGSNVGQFIGTSVLGGLADIAAMKHSLHGKIEKQASMSKKEKGALAVSAGVTGYGTHKALHNLSEANNQAKHGGRYSKLKNSPHNNRIIEKLKGKSKLGGAIALAGLAGAGIALHNKD